MSNYSSYPKMVKYVDYPKSQCIKHMTPKDTLIYKFERKRLGGNTITETGDKFGVYLYRNTVTNVLVSSWEKPSRQKPLYTGYDIGIHTDALEYYKNA